MPLIWANHPAMIKQVITSIAVVILIAACSQTNNTSHLITLNKGLEAANNIYAENNRNLYIELAQKLGKPDYYTESTIWKPRAEKLRDLTNNMLTYVDGLKKEMFSDTVNRDRVAHYLFLRLFAYKKDLLSLILSRAYEAGPMAREQTRIDSIEYLKTIPAISVEDNGAATEQTWIDSTFHNADSLMCRAMINTIENNILVSETMLLDYIDDRSNYLCGFGFEKFTAITSLNSTVTKSGESIEVTTGIGVFNTASKPNFIINGKKVEPDHGGVAVYSFKPNKKPGTYTVPVKIEYDKPDGTRESLQRDLRYTVVD